MENDQQAKVAIKASRKANPRSYTKSKRSRIRWTDKLHNLFLNAVVRLGGEDCATPKMILHAMGVDGITVAHVKSHLQMFRTAVHEKLIEDALEGAKKSGKRMNFIMPIIPQLLNCLINSRRPVNRRQNRLLKLKALLVKTALEKHFASHGPPLKLTQQQSELVEKMMAERDDFTTLYMPRQVEKKSHAYIIFDDILKTSSSTSATTRQGKKGKKKKKTKQGQEAVAQGWPTTNPRERVELYKEKMMNEYKSTDPDPTLQLGIGLPITPSAPNQEDISLDLTL